MLCIKCTNAYLHAHFIKIASSHITAWSLFCGKTILSYATKECYKGILCINEKLRNVDVE